MSERQNGDRGQAGGGGGGGDDDGFANGASPAFIANPELRQEAQRAFIWVAIVGMLALVVYIFQSILVIFGGLVFAAIIDGGSRLLGKVLPVGRGLRIAVILIATTAFFIWLGYFAGSQIAQQAAALPELVEQQVSNLIDLAQANGLEVQARELQSLSGQLISGVGTVTRALTGIVGGFTTVVLILIIGIYVAIEPNLYERGVEWLAPRTRRRHLSDTLDEMASTMRRLMAGRLLGMVLEGIFTFIALSLLGVPLAVLLGIVTGLLAFIPNVGAVVSGLLMALVGFSVDMGTGISALVVYVLVQSFDGYVIIPMIAKKTVDLAPALVLGFQLVLGILFGILGLLLADPLLAMIKVALERRSQENDELERLARDADRRLALYPQADAAPGGPLAEPQADGA